MEWERESMDTPESGDTADLLRDSQGDSGGLEMRRAGAGGTAASAEGDSNLLLVTLISTGGSVLEWFDFSVFGYFAGTFAQLFFPKGDKFAALASTFAVFAGAFCMRPVGGILFGYIGDKFGRKKAVVSSIAMMAIATFSMGCLPTYDQVGKLAPALLVLVRAFQGISTGGQLVGGFLFTVETAEASEKYKNYAGFFGGIVMASACVGTAAGSSVAYVIHRNMSSEALLSWGWRIPFWSGLLVGLLGFFAKDSIHEAPPPPKKPAAAAAEPQSPLRMALSNWRDILMVTLVASFWCVSFYLVMVWIVTYESDVLDPPVSGAFGINTVNLLLSIVLFLPFGLLGDKIGQANQMLVATVALMALSFPAYHLMQQGSATAMATGQFMLAVPLSAFGAALPAWMVRRCGGEARYTSIGIAYNAAQALLGGTAPLIATELARTGLPHPVASFHALVGLMVAIVLLLDRHCCGRGRMGSVEFDMPQLATRPLY